MSAQRAEVRPEGGDHLADTRIRAVQRMLRHANVSITSDVNADRLTRISTL
jgi:hypothetical protein